MKVRRDAGHTMEGLEAWRRWTGKPVCQRNDERRNEHAKQPNAAPAANVFVGRHQRRLAERESRKVRRSAYCLGPTVPVSLRRDDFTHPDTVSPVLGFEYITDDHPSDCA